MRPFDALINAVGVGLGTTGLIYSWSIITVIFSSMAISALLWPDWRYQTRQQRKKRKSKTEVFRESSINPLSAGVELEIIASNVNKEVVRESSHMNIGLRRNNSRDSDDESESEEG